MIIKKNFEVTDNNSLSLSLENFVSEFVVFWKKKENKLYQNLDQIVIPYIIFDSQKKSVLPGHLTSRLEITTEGCLIVKIIRSIHSPTENIQKTEIIGFGRIKSVKLNIDKEIFKVMGKDNVKQFVIAFGMVVKTIKEQYQIIENHFIAEYETIMPSQIKLSYDSLKKFLGQKHKEKLFAQLFIVIFSEKSPSLFFGFDQDVIKSLIACFKYNAKKAILPKYNGLLKQLNPVQLALSCLTHFPKKASLSQRVISESFVTQAWSSSDKIIDSESKGFSLYTAELAFFKLSFFFSHDFITTDDFCIAVTGYHENIREIEDALCGIAEEFKHYKEYYSFIDPLKKYFEELEKNDEKFEELKEETKKFDDQNKGKLSDKIEVNQKYVHTPSRVGSTSNSATESPIHISEGKNNLNQPTVQTHEKPSAEAPIDKNAKPELSQEKVLIHKSNNRRSEIESIFMQFSEITAETRKELIDIFEKREQQFIYKFGKLSFLTDEAIAELQKLPSLPKPGDVPLYRDRPDKKEEAMDFFFRVYKPWLDTGVVIYQDQLGGKNGIDPSLMKAIKNFFKSDGKAIGKVIPPKKERINSELNNIDCDIFNKKFNELERIKSAIRLRS